MALQKTVIRIPFTGLDTKADPKTGALGKLSLVENAIARRLSEGGIEFEKAFGFTSLGKTTVQGGTVTAGKKLGTLGETLFQTDGHTAWRYAGTSGFDVVDVGRVADIAAFPEVVVGNTGVGYLDTDVAYCNGYECHVVSREETHGGEAEYYIKNSTTGAPVVSSSISDVLGTSIQVRVVASSTAFFIFAWDGSATINCLKINTSGNMDPLVATSAAVVTDVDLVGAGVFEVMWDSTNSRMVLAYRCSGVLPLKVALVNTSMAVTNSTTLNHIPVTLGFLDWTQANGSFYLAVCTAAAGLRILTFNTTTLVATTTTIDAAATDVLRVSGTFVTGRNVLYTRAATNTYDRRTQGWTDTGGGTAYSVYRSVGLASRCFQIAGRTYVVLHYNGLTQNSLFLVEMVPDTNGGTAGDISVAGVLAAGDAGSWETWRRSVGSVAIVSSTKAVISFPTQTGGQPALSKANLDWTGTLTGRPVEFNGVAFIPGACAKVFDGQTVIEAGPHVYPEAPTVTQTTGGSLALTGVYEGVAVYFRRDASGRLWESAPSFPTSATLTGSNCKLTWTISTLRITEADSAYNPIRGVTPWQIAFYRTKDRGKSFYLDGIVDNDVTADSVTFVSTQSDTAIGANAKVYTDSGVVDNISPPAVLAFESHDNRLFAALGNGTVWHTKKLRGGDAAQFSDAFQVAVDAAGGPLTGLIPLNAAIVVAKRKKLYPIVGSGPTPDNNGAYDNPIGLEADVGMVGPRAFCSTGDGAVIKSDTGMQLLGRALDVTPLPGADTYDSLTVTGGASIDGLPHSALVTSDGRILKWDHQLKQWYTRTGHTAVACCLWRGRFTILQADGTVKYEDSSSYADGGVAFTMTLEGTFIDLTRAFLHQLLIRGEAQATCTLSVTLTYDFDATTAATPKTIALTTSGPKAPWVYEPDRGYVEAVSIKLTETSTGAGVKLSLLGFEVGILSGAEKHAAASYLG